MNLQYSDDVINFENEFGDVIRDLYIDEQFMSPTANIRDSEKGQDFIKCIEKMSPDLVPYHVLTEFVYDPQEEREIHQFAENIYTSIADDEESDDTLKKTALKIRLHLELAAQQKNSLYSAQEEKITEIDIKIKESNQKLKEYESELKKSEEVYSKIMSQYISILGIFAAILMAAFGSIQGFTSIYSNNTFSLVDSIILACVGFLGVILLLFMLLNSIAKLSGKSLDSNHGDEWYKRHPTLINSFILLSTISLVAITYKVSINPPNFSWLGIVYIVPLFYFFALLNYFNKKN